MKLKKNYLTRDKEILNDFLNMPIPQFPSFVKHKWVLQDIFFTLPCPFLFKEIDRKMPLFFQKYAKKWEIKTFNKNTLS